MPALLADAQAPRRPLRRDQPAGRHPATGTGWSPTTSTARAATSSRAWPTGRPTGFHVQHEGQQLAQVQIHLYDGDGAAAYRRVREVWTAYRRSAIFTVQMARVDGLHERAPRSPPPRWPVPGERRALLADARRCARRIARTRTPWGLPLAAMSRAAAARLEGDDGAAVTLLERATARLDAADMTLYAAVARLRIGQLVGGDAGAALVADATQWMASQGIVRPERVAALLAPGY